MVELSAAAISAIAASVSAGASIADSVGNMVAACNHRVVSGVEVANCTKYHLEVEGCFINNGQIEVPPTSINPGTREALLGHQTGALCSGTTGVAAWKIGDTNLNLVILWSAPYNFDHYANWLGVGFYEGKIHVEWKTYHEMYFEAQTWFKRKDFYYDTDPLTYEDKNRRFKIKGTMGTSHKSQAKIDLLPLTADVVADSLKSVVYSHS